MSIQGQFREYYDKHIEYEEVRQWIIEHGGESVKSIRERCGFSLRAFAQIMEISPSYLSKIERGKETLSPDFANRIGQWVRYDAHCAIME